MEFPADQLLATAEVAVPFFSLCLTPQTPSAYPLHVLNFSCACLNIQKGSLSFGGNRCLVRCFLLLTNHAVCSPCLPNFIFLSLFCSRCLFCKQWWKTCWPSWHNCTNCRGMCISRLSCYSYHYIFCRPLQTARVWKNVILIHKGNQWKPNDLRGKITLVLNHWWQMSPMWRIWYLMIHDLVLRDQSDWSFFDVLATIIRSLIVHTEMQVFHSYKCNFKMVWNYQSVTC